MSHFSKGDQVYLYRNNIHLIGTYICDWFWYERGGWWALFALDDGSPVMCEKAKLNHYRTEAYYEHHQKAMPYS